MVGGGFQNIFKIPELKRDLFTLGAADRLSDRGARTDPGIDTLRWRPFSPKGQRTLLGLFNMFSGGALERLSVFALGIMPYISASIILQLLTVVPFRIWSGCQKRGRGRGARRSPSTPATAPWC
jgi:preprotein translocase subunit SecY